jgi:hypothetical protein
MSDIRQETNERMNDELICRVIATRMMTTKRR